MLVKANLRVVVEDGLVGVGVPALSITHVTYGDEDMIRIVLRAQPSHGWGERVTVIRLRAPRTLLKQT